MKYKKRKKLQKKERDGVKRRSKKGPEQKTKQKNIGSPF
jgi:hypothetical protein